jgi:hypothetical protein
MMNAPARRWQHTTTVRTRFSIPYYHYTASTTGRGMKYVYGADSRTSFPASMASTPPGHWFLITLIATGPELRPQHAPQHGTAHQGQLLQTPAVSYHAGKRDTLRYSWSPDRLCHPTLVTSSWRRHRACLMHHAAGLGNLWSWRSAWRETRATSESHIAKTRRGAGTAPSHIRHAHARVCEARSPR